MLEDPPKLFHMLILTQSGVTIYQQQLNEREFEDEFIDKIATIALGFINTMDVSLSSINYRDYTIYFKRGSNFLAVLLANSSPMAEEVINQMFNDMLRNKILGKFIEYAHYDKTCDNPDIISSIKKILYNLDFVTSVSGIKQEFADYRRF